MNSLNRTSQVSFLYRFSDHAGSGNKAAHAIFIKKICLALTGSTKLKVKMQPGEQILQEVSSIIEDTAAMEQEQHIPQNERVVTQALRRTFEQQKKHFLHCLDAPPGLEHVVHDRFGRACQTWNEEFGSFLGRASWHPASQVFKNLLSVSPSVPGI